MSDGGDTPKLDMATAQRDWSDLGPDEAAELFKKVEQFQEFAKRLPEMSDSVKDALKVDEIVKKLSIDRQARRKIDAEESVELFYESRKTANAGPVDLGAMLITPPEGSLPRVWDPVSNQVLMRKGQIGSLAGPDKGGKTRIAVSLMNALLDPEGKTPFLGYYSVEPLTKDQVVVHIALEEDDADMFSAWSPYLRHNPDRADRVISISYSGVNVNMIEQTIRDEIATEIFAELQAREKKLGRELEIGAVVIDPLFAMAQGDYNKDPRLATDVFNAVLKTWCKEQLGAEIVVVLAHTSREGGRMGGEGSIYGSIGWASKMHFLWYVQKDQKQDDYRIFGANRGRADTYAFPQRLYMLTEDDGPGRAGQVEVRPEEGEEAAKERAAGRTEGPSIKAPSKTKVLRERLEDMINDGGGKEVLARDMIDRLETEATRVQEAGLTVPFLFDKTAVSKVLKIITADGMAERVEVEDPTDKTKKTPAWKSTTHGPGGHLPTGTAAPETAPDSSAVDSGAGTDGSLIPPASGAGWAERARIVEGPDGEQFDAKTGLSIAPPPAPPAID